jgi:hypothetical protein
MEKRKETILVHMIQYVVLVFLMVSIHILFQQTNYLFHWGYSLLQLLLIIVLIITLFFIQFFFA